MEQFVIGSMLGPYRIEGLLGAGGMGRVYKARDTRLDRPVAIKTSDERFNERFAREARAISALNHPHVCTLYDVGPDYLVMELIEGMTLKDRLAAGPMPLDDALAIAAQIASALDAAHEAGIVHRDLKPANINVSPTGTVKVLDFGLAKWAPHGEADATVGPELTEVGAVLGTSGYMAPEQMQGRPIDKRADIWAFGVVLYEMLTGTRPTVSGVRKSALDAVLAAEPRWAQAPRSVQRLVRRCLAEDPRDRLRDIADVRWLLEDEPASSEMAPATPSRRAFAGVLAAGVGAAAFGVWGWLRTPVSQPPQRSRFLARLPAGQRVYQEAVTASSLALSPDGRLLAIAATGSEGRQLYLRKFDELEATPLAGTEGAAAPFFSPDGRWIGFFADGRLQRVPAEGGPVVEIAAAPGPPIGASWGSDGRIVFTCGWRSPLFMVPASGGDQAEVVVPLDPARDINMRRPDLLPNGRVVLLDGLEVSRRNFVKAIDLDSGRRIPIMEGTTVRYVASGHLIIGQRTALFVAPFDVQSFTLTGPAVPLIENVAVTAGSTQQYAVSDGGVLAYAPAVERSALALIDLESGAERILDEKSRFHRPRFDPDGTRLAVAVGEPSGARRGGDDVWVYDVADSGPGSRITSEGATGAVWRDRTTLTYAAEQFWTDRAAAAAGLYTRSVSGREEQRLAALAEFHRPIGWTSEGLLFELTTDAGDFRIELLSEDGERRFVVGGRSGRLSLEGQVLAFTSDRSGREAVYVMALDDSDSQWIADGRDPAWAPGGRLHYWVGDRLMAAPVDLASRLRVGSASRVLDLLAPFSLGDYDISPDGRTLALVRSADPERERDVVVAFDWLA